jgi:hypothetical protein
LPGGGGGGKIRIRNGYGDLGLQNQFVVISQGSKWNYVLLEGQAPRLLVKIHGGTTSQAGTAFSLGIQYRTSRGEDWLIHPVGEVHGLFV